MKQNVRIFYAALGVVALFFILSIGSAMAKKSTETNPYIRAPVNLDKAPNGAIANKKLLDGLEVFNWLKPTIENPAKGVWVVGGFGLAPMSIIEAKDGLIPDTHISLHGVYWTMFRHCQSRACLRARRHPAQQV